VIVGPDDRIARRNAMSSEDLTASVVAAGRGGAALEGS